MFDISVTPRSLPLVLYPPLEMSILELRVSEFPGQVFRLWMPEMVTSPEHGQIYNQAKVGPQHWQSDATGSTLYCQVFKTELLCVGTRVHVRSDHLDLEYEIENVGNSTLLDIKMGTCYQLAAAPDFADQEGDRTYAWADGRLANVAQDGIRAECHEHHHPEKSSFLNVPDSERAIGVMCVEARSGGATAIAWQTHSQYTGNTDPALCCIHAGPKVDCIPAGSHLVLRGWLGWSPGSAAALCDRARRALEHHSEQQPRAPSPSATS